MSSRSVSPRKAEFVEPLSPGVNIEKPQKITAFYLNPTCEHNWGKLARDLQTLEAEGKIIWKCRTCAEITSTYDWQTPH